MYTRKYYYTHCYNHSHNIIMIIELLVQSPFLFLSKFAGAISLYFLLEVDVPKMY